MSDLVGVSHLRVSHVWHEEVMADEVLTEPRPVTLGQAAGVTFVTPPLGLPEGFEIVRPGARGYLLTVGAGMSGRLRLGGEELDVAEFVRTGGGRDDDRQGDFRATGIEPGDWGVIDLDGTSQHRLFFHFVKADPPLPPSTFRDGALLGPAYAFALIAHAVLLIIAFHFKPDRPGFVFPGKRELVAGYLVNRSRPPEPEPAQPRPGDEKAEEVVPPSSTQGAEGKAGGEGEKERQRAPDPDQGAAEATLPEAVQVGLLSRRSRAAIKKTLDRGGFDEKLGQAVARMQGAVNDGTMAGTGKGAGTGLGDASGGTGTSTRGGKGSGGGGRAIGDLQTHGAIATGGDRAARGVMGGKGVKEVAVKVDTGAPDGDLGGLTEAEILKVVSSRKNGLKTCYERELQRSKDLGGKVIIGWKIDARGQVLDARVQSSTMRNGRVEDCLVRQVSSMRFPPPRNGSSAKVRFPFLFAPR